MVKTRVSTAGGMVFILGQGAEIPPAMQPKKKKRNLHSVVNQPMKGKIQVTTLSIF